jgi:hypothetical protein
LISFLINFYFDYKIELSLISTKKNNNGMKHSLTFTDTTITLDSGTIQTRKVKEPELVCKRLKLMGIESLKPFQARRMFEQGIYFCDDKEISLTYDETSVTIDTCVGDFTRIVKNPKFVWFRLRALGIESQTTQQAKRLFDRGCSFYDTREKLSLALREGQMVRHTIKIKDQVFVREAVFTDGVLEYDMKSYASLNAFVSGHFKAVHPTRKAANAWLRCETFVDSKWVNLRNHYFFG